MVQSRVTLIAVLAVIAVMLCSTAYSANDDPVTVAGILKDAKCAFSDDQQKDYDGIDFENGREAFRTLFGLFSEKQNKALIKALGSREGRNGGEHPRYLMQVVMFEKAGCPLTKGQIDKLLKLPDERGSREEAQKIYTDKQRDEMQKRFQGRRGGRNN